MKTTLKIMLVLVVLAALAIPLAALVVGRVAWQATQAVQGAWVASTVPVVVRGPVAGSLAEINWDISGGPRMQGPSGDQFVLGGAYTLDEDETLEGNLVVLGGIATLEPGSTVEGDAVIMGGTLRVDGRVEGSIVAIGGQVDLGETAVVEGDVETLGGYLTRADGARIEGDVNLGTVDDFRIVPGHVFTPNVVSDFGVAPDFGVANILFDALGVLLRALVWMCLAAGAVLFFPQQSERAGRVVVSQPLPAGGLGLLTVVIAPVLLVAFAITIIGIPVTLVGIFLLVVAWAFGVIVIGLEVGKRLAQALKQEWAPAVSAALGAFLVTLVGNTVGAIIPCIGWMLPAVVGMLGLGAVMLTRFGSQPYPAYAPASQAPVEPLLPQEADEPELEAPPVVEDEPAPESDDAADDEA